MLTNGQCKTIFKQPFDDPSIITINYSIQYITLNNPPKNVWPFILQPKQYRKY